VNKQTGFQLATEQGQIKPKPVMQISWQATINWSGLVMHKVTLHCKSAQQK